MISGWRSDRRIGPASLGEQLADPVLFALKILPFIMAGTIIIVLVKTWGQPLSAGGYIRFGCTIFGMLTGLIVVGGLFGPGRDRVLVLAVLSAGLAAFVWYFGLPMLSVFGLVQILPITPVNP